MPTVSDAGVLAVAQGKINNPVFTAKEHAGLSQALSQDSQPAAFASCQDHGQAFGFSHSIPSSRARYSLLILHLL
jgi:hypothetical protein